MEVEAIWKLLSLKEGGPVLELGCGYGRITNRLEGKGARVTGLDTSPVLLKNAEADTAERGVNVEYVLGDMRSLPWRDCFDAVFLWYTTFGYFNEADNEKVLHEVARSFRKGRAAANRSTQSLLSDKSPSYAIVRRNDELRMHISNYDALIDRCKSERAIARNGCLTRMRLSVKHYGFSEYVRMLRSAGFETVEACGKAESSSPHGRRLVVVEYK
ncbi:class I SAM-dependent methyltransferase (plasmid) [Sinorhizobium garamanticum]|uniref:Class I SAM-dependent methyltransferase n=1 Tax=Sinorhizobium garamanticum TaxID=680247 RepID=A0ABY8DRP6_9HYPH|nr:class I SAM-dependent methyltransferase [Sinorhizobium garamanticum]WEX91616.1 class I SAM-dependent methyltransferase [Sinorhizobium garamanticum]